MVSLVLVSHSRAMAEAVAALARQMAPPEVRMSIAAGVGDARQEFGTDAVDISEAVQSVDSAEGVIVLMDLGSAVLSAETALDLLPDDVRARIRLCAAPFVEGAVVAAVQAGLGSDLDTVCAEASQALQPKQEQIGSHTEPSYQHDGEPAGAPVTSPDAQEVTVTLRNMHGLHARPAAQFVQTAGSFDADVRVHKASTDSAPVSARSLNQLATLGALQGDQIVITATGVEAANALRALKELVESGFGEQETAPTTREAGPGSEDIVGHPSFRALAVSPGIGIGTLKHYRPNLVLPPEQSQTPHDPQVEIQHLQQAVDITAQEIAKHHASLPAGTPQEGIFQAHLLILRDESLLGRTRQLILDSGQPAAQAWYTAISEVAEAYRKLPDAYLQQRAADVLDVGAQVLARLTGQTTDQPMALSEPAVLMATEFTPTQVSQLDRTNTLALISSAGGVNSHATILARALGIPMVSGAGQPADELTEGALVGVDGSSGAVYVNPSPEEIDQLTTRRDTWLAQQKQLRLASGALTLTRDGRRVEVAANLSGLAEGQVAVANGAEAVGVLRTEFLYLTRTTAPTEDEQVTALRQIASYMQGRPVIVRTLDIGGDKQIPYIAQPVEANPYLGVRAIRISLQQPALFATQIRAILRAGADSELRILLPMITLREELIQVHDLIEAAHQALVSEGLPHRWPMQVGIMVETPATALLAHTMTDLADFYSIGTNDLTQYTLAAERGNPHLAAFADALHPAVLKLIQQVVVAAHEAGKWAGVCGEVAGDPTAAPVLVGLDVDELSMSVAGIPRVKAVIRQLDMPSSRALAQAALQARTADEVRQLARGFALQPMP